MERRRGGIRYSSFQGLREADDAGDSQRKKPVGPQSRKKQWVPHPEHVISETRRFPDRLLARKDRQVRQIVLADTPLEMETVTSQEPLSETTMAMASVCCESDAPAINNR
jgi:hypothetical protein